MDPNQKEQQSNHSWQQSDYEPPNRWFMKVFPKLLAFSVLDGNYLLVRKNHKKEFRPFIQDFHKRYKEAAMLGLGFGLALCLSLRRYFPTAYERMSPKRFMMEMMLVMTTSIFSFCGLFLDQSRNINELKKAYVLQRDQGMLQHIERLDTMYHIIDQEQHLARLLGEDQFVRWREKIENDTDTNEDDLKLETTDKSEAQNTP